MNSFDAKAAGWDTPMRTDRAQKVAAFIRSELKPAAGIRLLDVGAGTGVFGLSFYDLARSITCIDTSAGMLAELERKIASAGLSGVEAREHDISASPVLAGGPFDLAVSMMAFHHIPDYRAALASIRQSLAPGGILCLVDLDSEDGSFHGAEADIPHLGFDRESLGREAEEAGFHSAAFYTPYTITKETDAGERDFSLFLMAAKV